MQVRLSLLLIAILIGSADCSGQPAKMDGVKEGGSAPVTLYAHQYNSVVPGYQTPGLLNCDPLTLYHHVREHPAIAKEAERLFLPLPDADHSEGARYSREERQRAESAVRFARAHNHAAFRTGAAYILRLCPQARLVDY
ncbi:hypothetical protein PMI04_003045 [Sphingobium sp. AP49]|uniref:hypothetical protein n=1 Tax=Sphingobium sp. AP49 TaxID=1144307 RepID=UPI00026EE13A|nr:hypothetical protein [Sphingobium sp. AP49]WHO39589.1 hypothetical protein PMI04_003045 [Sphingobium sp. AP49]